MVAVLISICSPAAQAAESIAVERPVRTVLAPASFRAFGALSDKEFDYGLSEAYRQGVRRYLANHDAAYRVVTPEAVREKLRSQPVFAETLGVAEDWAKLGVENYKHLRTEDAIRQLENAIEKYGSIDYQYVDPERVAEVAMYLALSYLNQGDNAARPLALMKRMIRLDPDRVLRKGFYPDKIANFYASARQDALRRLQREGPPAERARALAELMEADLVVFGTVVPRGDGRHQARLFVYSVPDEGFVEPETVGIGAETAEAFRGAGNRLMSRVTPCVYEPTDTGDSETIVDSQGEGPLSIQLNFTYASFLRYPESISKPFGNIGLSMDTHLLLTEEFGLRFGIGVMRSLRDYSGRIVEHLNTVRAQVGPDLAVDIGQFNVGLSVGLEGANISPFVVCKELNEPAQETGCPNESDRETYDDLAFLLGANVRPRLRMRLFDTFDVTTGAGYTFYFVPFTGQPLNSPVSGHVGIQYRF